MAWPFVRLLLLFFVLGGLVVVGPRAPLLAEREPGITLSPSSGPAGTSVSVTGVFAGCSIPVNYQLLWDNDVISQGDSIWMPGSGGYGLNTRFTVPGGSNLGVHRVQVPVKTAPCWRTFTAPFTVTSGLTP